MQLLIKWIKFFIPNRTCHYPRDHVGLNISKFSGFKWSVNLIRCPQKTSAI